MKLLDSPTLYYCLRILQRLSLLSTGLLTVIYWAYLLNIEVGSTLSREQVGHQWNNATALHDAISTATDRLTLNAILAALVAAALSLALLLLPRVRRFEKRVVVDGVVIAAFCALSVVLSITLETSFIRHYLAQYPIAI